MTSVVHTNALFQQRGSTVALPPARRRLSAIMCAHGRGTVPLVFRRGQDWRRASRVEIDRAARMRAHYASTLVGPRDTVVLVRLPRGSNGGSIALLLAGIALTALAGPIGGAIAGGLEMGALGAFALKAGLAIGGAALLYAANRSKASKKSEDAFADLRGGGNVARAGDRRPLIYGGGWSSPPLAQKDYFLYAAYSTVVYKRLVLGIGKFDVEQIRIGESLLWDKASGIQAPFGANQVPGQETAVEILYEQPSTIMGGDYIPSDSVSGQELPRPSGNPNKTPWFRLTPHGVVADKVMMSWQYLGFGYTSSEGKRKPYYSGLAFEAQRLDPLTGNPTGPVLPFGAFVEMGLSSTPIHRTGTHTLPDKAEWQIRGWNQWDENPSVDLVNAITWDGMTAIVPSTRIRAKTTEIVIRIGGAKGLPVSSLSDVMVKATRILPVWTGTAWVEQPTRKAVWAYADLVRAEYGLDDPGAIDVAKCFAYANRADLAGFDEYNGVLPNVASFREAAAEILAPLRAEPAKIGAIHSFVRDESAAEAGGRRVITRRQIVRDSGSQIFDYTTSESNFGDVIVEYDRDGDPKRPDEVRQNKFALTRTPKRYRFKGLRDGAHALMIANWLAARSMYRGDRRKMRTEWDGRLIFPGTHVAADLWFFGEGKTVVGVAEAVGNTLTLDAQPETAPGATCALIRTRTGREWGILRATYDGGTGLALDATDVGNATSATGLSLADVLARETQDPTTVMIGDVVELQQTYMATSAVPVDERQVDLEMVYDDPRVWQVLGETIVAPPAPVSDQPAVIKRPSVPSVSARCERIETGIELVWGIATAHGAASYDAQLSYDAGATWETIQEQRANQSGRVPIRQSDDPVIFRARAFGQTGLPGEWKQVSFVTVAPQIDGGRTEVTGLPITSLLQSLQDLLAGPATVPGSIAEARAAGVAASTRAAEAFSRADAAWDHLDEVDVELGQVSTRFDTAEAAIAAAQGRADDAFGRADGAWDHLDEVEAQLDQRLDAAEDAVTAAQGRADEAWGRAEAAWEHLGEVDAQVGQADVAIAAVSARADDAVRRAGNLRQALSYDPIDRARSGESVRSVRDDIEALAGVLGDLQSRTYDLHGRLVEIGVEMGPEGVYRIAGQARTDGRLTKVALDLDALAGKVELMASAALDGDLDGLFDRLAEVSLALDAVNASLTAKVDAAAFEPQVVRIDHLSIDMSAAQEAIALKAAQTTVEALQGTVSNALLQIQAQGRIIASVSSASTALDAELRDATIDAILGRLHEMEGSIGASLANATFTLGARTEDNGRSIAEMGRSLLALSGQSSAWYQELVQTIADGDTAQARRSAALEAGAAGALARIIAEEQSRATADASLSSRTTALEATVNSGATGLVATRAWLSSEETARAGADTALATRATALESTVGGSDKGNAALLARIVTEETTRANADSAAASRLTALESTVNSGVSGLVVTRSRLIAEETTRADADTALSGRTTVLEAAIGSGTSGLSALLARIVAEETARATADTALATRTTALESTVNDATTGLPATRSRLLTEETTRADADNALSSRATALESAVGSGTSGNVALLSRLITEETARASADSAAASRLTSLESVVNDNVTGLVATRSRLLMEETTRATADVALSTRTTALESATANAAADLAQTLARLVSEEQTRAAGDAAEARARLTATALSQTDAGLRDATIDAILGQLHELAGTVGAQIANATFTLGARTEDNGRSIAEMGRSLLAVADLSQARYDELVRTIADGDTASTQAITALAAQIGNPVTGLAQTFARLITEETTRATADTAAAGRLTSLESTVNDVATGLVATRSRLLTEETTRADTDAALSTRTGTLEATVGASDKGNAALLARLVAEETTRASADTAATGRLTALESTVNNSTTGLAPTLARLIAEETTRASADTALASRATALESTVGALGDGAASTLARLIAEETTRASADTAEANARSTLSAQVNHATTGLPATRTRLITEEQTRADADDTLGSRAAALESTVNDNVTGLVATRGRLLTEETTRATADSAAVGRLNALEAITGAADKGNTALLARIASEETARANADGAAASRLNALEASVGSGTSGNAALLSRLVTEETARATADTAAATRLTSLEGTVNNATTGLVQTRADFLAYQQAQATTNSAVSSSLSTHTAQIGQHTADISTANAARVSGDQANAAAALAAQATADSVTAGARFSVTSRAGPNAGDALIAMQVSKASGGTKADAGFYLLAPDSGPTQAIVDADLFYVGKRGGDGSFESIRKLLFVDAVTERVMITDLYVTGEMVAPGAIAGSAYHETPSVPVLYGSGYTGGIDVEVSPVAGSGLSLQFGDNMLVDFEVQAKVGIAGAGGSAPVTAKLYFEVRDAAGTIVGSTVTLTSSFMSYSGPKVVSGLFSQRIRLPLSAGIAYSAAFRAVYSSMAISGQATLEMGVINYIAIRL